MTAAGAYEETLLGPVVAVQRAFTLDLEACRTEWNSLGFACWVYLLPETDGEQAASTTAQEFVFELDGEIDKRVVITPTRRGYSIHVEYDIAEGDAPEEAEFEEIESLVRQAIEKVPQGKVTVVVFVKES